MAELESQKGSTITIQEPTPLPKKGLRCRLGRHSWLKVKINGSVGLQATGLKICRRCRHRKWQGIKDKELLKDRGVF